MKQFWIKQLLFFSFLVLFLPVLSALNFAQDNYSDRKIVLINDVNVSMALGKHMRFLEDKDRYLTIEDFFFGNFEQQFRAGKNDIINLGIVDANVWIEFPPIFNYSDTKQWYIIIGNESTTPLESISFYFLQNNKFVHLVEIPSVKQHQIDTKFPFLSIPIPEGLLKNSSQSIEAGNLQIFAKASYRGRADLSFHLADTKVPRFFYPKNFFLIFFFGAIVVLFLYNLVVPFFLKELTYIYYNLYLFFWVGVALIGYHKFEVFFGFHLSYFSHFIGGVLASIFIIEFCNELFKTKESLPSGYLWLLTVQMGFFALILFSLVNFLLAFKLAFVLGTIMLVSVLVIGIICFLRGQYYARLFIIGWGIFMLTTVVWIFCLSGVLPYNFITSQIQIFGLLCQTLFLSFALLDRYSLLRKRVATANDKLKKANAQLIHVFGITVETRDAYTAGHQFRVSSLAEAIATQMRLDTYFVENVKLSALIHDIGKIGIPKKILIKKTNLSEKEFKRIQEHVNFGYQIIKDLDIPATIKKGILHHHERLDGSGYPNGIKKHKISLVGKILAVADTVEAVTNARPYREALGLEKAFDIIKENKNFDKRVVRACNQVFKKGFNFPQVVRYLGV